MGYAVILADFGALPALFGPLPLSFAGERGRRGGNVCSRLSTMSE